MSNFIIAGGHAAAASVSCRGRISSLASYGATESGKAYKVWLSGALSLPAAGYRTFSSKMNFFSIEMLYFIIDECLPFYLHSAAFDLFLQILHYQFNYWNAGKIKRKSCCIPCLTLALCIWCFFYSKNCYKLLQCNGMKISFHCFRNWACLCTSKKATSSTSLHYFLISNLPLVPCMRLPLCNSEAVCSVILKLIQVSVMHLDLPKIWNLSISQH